MLPGKNKRHTLIPQELDSEMCRRSSARESTRLKTELSHVQVLPAAPFSVKQIIVFSKHVQKPLLCYYNKIRQQVHEDLRPSSNHVPNIIGSYKIKRNLTIVLFPFFHDVLGIFVLSKRFKKL